MELAAAGDFDAIARRAIARATGRAPLLPNELALAPRPKPDFATAVERRFAVMISPPLTLTGAPISQVELGAGLRGRGWRIETWAAADGPARRLYEEMEMPVRIEPLLNVVQSTPARYEAGISRLAAAFGASGAGVVYANTVDLFPAIDAARVAGLPSVWNIRESENWRARLADRHPRVAARALAAFSYPQNSIFVAEAAARAWRDFTPEDRRSVIYNAPHPRILDVGDRGCGRRLLGAAEGSCLFLSVGTICPRKGQIDIAEALELVPPDMRRSIHIAFVGGADDRYLKALRRSFKAAGSPDARFIGELSDARDALAGADVLVNTSRAEAFPRTFIEAAAAGAAIIAADVDGVGERLVDGESALFYRPGDVAALAGRMSELAADGGLRARLAKGARKALIEDWRFDDMIGAYEATFAGAAEPRE